MQQPKSIRVMIFVDFWNYTLNMAATDETFKTDWFALPWAVAENTRKVLKVEESFFRYEGIFIAGSYNQFSTADRNLNNWAQNTLIKVDGAKVDFKPRQKMQKGPCCQGVEHHEVAVCPYCAATMLGTREKGVDTQIVTEMMRCAWEGLYDVGIIISEDQDFAPAIEHLTRKGFKFIHARFPGRGYELRKHCWGEIDLAAICQEFRR